MIGQEHYPILNNCVFNWSLGSTYIIYMLLISWAIVQIPYNDNDKIRYKIIQSWQYISFQQRDWWCNITLYWLLKRLFQLYSTGERQTKGERRCFLRLKPIVYVYDNLRQKIKIISFSLDPPKGYSDGGGMFSLPKLKLSREFKPSLGVTPIRHWIYNYEPSRMYKSLHVFFALECFVYQLKTFLI